MMKLVKTISQEPTEQRLSKQQFFKLLKSEKGAYEVCSEFLSKSTLLEDKSKIADIASRVYRFAKGRKHESNAQKFLMGQYLTLGGLTTIAAAIFKVPLLTLIWIPHTLMTFVISNLATTTRPYASKTPPIFKANDKIAKETQAYLEHLEFSEFKNSIDPKIIAMRSETSTDKDEYWYQSLLKTKPC